MGVRRHEMRFGKYSFGIGDRFGHQGQAQLAAMIKAKQQGVEITPVWNKSNREHTIIGTKPADVRKEADAAVKACGWKGPYFVDADHIGLGNVDGFIDASDFFTLDVADFIGQARPDRRTSTRSSHEHRDLLGSHQIEGIARAGRDRRVPAAVHRRASTSSRCSRRARSSATSKPSRARASS